MTFISFLVLSHGCWEYHFLCVHVCLYLFSGWQITCSWFCTAVCDVLFFIFCYCCCFLWCASLFLVFQVEKPGPGWIRKCNKISIAEAKRRNGLFSKDPCKDPKVCFQLQVNNNTRADPELKLSNARRALRKTGITQYQCWCTAASKINLSEPALQHCKYYYY